MTTGHLTSFLRRLHRAALSPDGPGDGQLLECFIARRDEAAFEALVRRHGPMVWGVCRRVLRNDADAEDAFQATFLVLTRKAAAVAHRAALGAWLYGVAHNTALKAKSMNDRRRVKERRSAEAPRPDAADEPWRDLLPLLDAELSRLPDKYRAPIVLCELEGRTLKEAARQIGCPPGTAASRLARGRALLARRLARHGPALSGDASASALFLNAASAGAPAPLVACTVKAAASFAAGQAATAGMASAKVVALTEGVLKVMLLNKLKWATVFLLLLGVCGVGMGVFACRAGADERGGRQLAARDAKPPASTDARGPAAEILKEAAEAARAVEDKQSKAWTLLAIAEAQAKGGDWDAAAKTYKEAIQAAKEIKDDPKGPDPAASAHHTIGWVAITQAKAGDVKAALETAKAMEDDGARDYALANIAAEQANAGDVKGALATAEGVSFNRRDWVMRAVSASQAAAGEFKDAAQTAEKIGDAASRAFALLAVAGAQVRRKDPEAAKKTLEGAVKLGDSLPEADADKGEDGSARAGVFGGVARLQAEMGDVKAARQTADGLKERWKSNALKGVAAAQAAAGDVKGALETAEAIEGEYPKGEAFKEVVTAQLRAGDLKGGRQTADAIKSVFWRVASLTEIAKAEAKAGDRAAAAKTFQQALDAAGKDGADVSDDAPGMSGLRNGALCLIAQARAEAGEEKEALAWAAKQSSPLLKAQALLNVARGIALRKEAEKKPEK
jgi:RNA polymerase sigma factor (sigma-70 family)